MADEMQRHLQHADTESRIPRSFTGRSEPMNTNNSSELSTRNNLQCAEMSTSARASHMHSQHSRHYSAIERDRQSRQCHNSSPNVGLQIMQRMGYQQGTGLGKYNTGITEPIDVAIRPNRMGLGSGSEKASKRCKITKTENIKNSKKEPVKRKREQTPKFIKSVVSKVRYSDHERRQTEKPRYQDRYLAQPTRNYKYINRHKYLEYNIRNARPKLMPREKYQPQRRCKHSPIRAPTPPPASMRLQQQNASAISRTRSSAIERKSNRMEVTGASRSPAPSPQQQNNEAGAEATRKPPNLKFTMREPPTTKQLLLIYRQFRNEIELLKFKLGNLSLRWSSATANESIMIAKIVMTNHPSIAKHIFEYVRNEIIGWIGRYQFLKYPTPIFHYMFNNGTHITVICENFYAYECLYNCIMDVWKNIDVLGPISVSRLPAISTKVLYCFGAVYAGTIRNTELFTTQISLHNVELKAERWIVVSHEVSVKTHETYFMFLLDQQSALALTYHCKNELYVCMNKINFSNRGYINI